MNEYTYKAKKIKDGEWTKGSLFAGTNHTLILQGINLKGMSVKGNEVDRESVCQYADKGLWEHDIIKCEDAIGVIRYGENDGEYGFYVHWSSEHAVEFRDDFVYWANREDVAVIGNEIDNPELLEG